MRCILPFRTFSTSNVCNALRNENPDRGRTCQGAHGSSTGWGPKSANIRRIGTFADKEQKPTICEGVGEKEKALVALSNSETEVVSTDQSRRFATGTSDLDVCIIQVSSGPYPLHDRKTDAAVAGSQIPSDGAALNRSRRSTICSPIPANRLSALNRFLATSPAQS
jgi:hypothetical protein